MPNTLSKRKNPQLGNSKKELDALCDFHNYDFRKYKGTQSIQKVARNLVDYVAGKTILETVLGLENQINQHQIKMF